MSNKTEEDYWEKYWANHAQDTKKDNRQKQVLRTLHGEPINEKSFRKVLKWIAKNIKVKETDTILDLGCGNGIITEYLANRSKQVVGVDFTEELLNQVDTQKHPNIDIINKDMREVRFEKSSFDKVLLYFSLQYLSKIETIELFEAVRRWLKKGGIFYLGDIPNQKEIWSFFNTEKREKVYFDKIKNENPIIGTWFDPDWLLKLGEYSNFKDSEVINQPENFLYSHYRFDARFVK